MDEFASDLLQAENVRKQLIADLQQRDRKLEQNELTARLDAKIRSGLQELAVNVDHLVREVQTLKMNPSKVRLPQKELDRRFQAVRNLERDFNQLDNDFKRGRKQIQNVPRINFRAQEGVGESTETRNMTTKELAAHQTQMLRNQEQLEDGLVGVTQNLVVIAGNIGDELTLQNGLLEKVEENVDHTQLRMNKTTFRMKELIYKSADGCMICCIVVLIVVIVLLLVLL